jgi:hypothetical protein
LKRDPNVTTRDVLAKFGDDATDTVKQYVRQASIGAGVEKFLRQKRLRDMINTLYENNRL